MLAFRCPNLSKEIVQILRENDVDINVKHAKTGDGILHLCAKHCKNNELLEYVITDLKQSVHTVNYEDENAVDICKRLKKWKALDLIERLSKSNSITESYKAEQIAK